VALQRQKEALQRAPIQQGQEIKQWLKNQAAEVKNSSAGQQPSATRQQAADTTPRSASKDWDPKDKKSK
jgi:hypothetical protein